MIWFSSMKMLTLNSSLVVDEIYTTLSDGFSYSVQLGNLALNLVVNQIFTESSGISSINASLISNWLFEQEAITNTYDLHIGSAAKDISLSLWLEGYDRSRVLGAVSSQFYTDNDFKIDFLDIGIDVDNGVFSFNFTDKQKLLDQGNSSMDDSTSVFLDSLDHSFRCLLFSLYFADSELASYLHLSKSTCDAIASYLFVTYQSKYQLYIWDVSNADYESIITFSFYLSFTFRAFNIKQFNMTINVSFQLLNLTLEAFLAETFTQYFSCRFSQNEGAYILDRAFLQIAFVEIQWSTAGSWFLAQASGSNTATTSQLEILTNIVSSFSNSWSDSWADHWTPITNSSSINSANATSSSTNTASTGSPKPNAGLSTGAKAGIGIGCAVAGALLIGFALYLYRAWAHRRLAKSNENGIAQAPIGANHEQIAEQDLGVFVPMRG